MMELICILILMVNVQSYVRRERVLWARGGEGGTTV